VVPILERLIRRESALALERSGAAEGAEASLRKGLKKNEVFAMIIVPTRELAVQVWEVFEIFFEALRKAAKAEMASNSLEGEEPSTEAEPEEDTEQQTIVEATYPSPLLLVSGQQQSRSTSTNPPPAPIIISTPGRLASYLTSMTSSSSSASTSAYARARRALSLDQFEVLTLDEADGLLSSKDHLKNLEVIWKALPRQRRNWLFSATMMDLLSERNGNGQIGLGALGGGAGLELAGLRNLTRVVVRVEAKVKKRKREEGEEPEDEVSGKKGSGKEERRTPLL
jgi:ATP-dependent RNA helicase DDX55/SPB4